MKATRTVHKSDATTAEDARRYISSETGGEVAVIGEPIDRDDFWECEVWSGDGRTPVAAADRSPKFLVRAISKCGKFVRLKDQTGFEFDSPRTLPAYGADFVGADLPKTITLEVGQVVGGRTIGHDALTDVWVESGPNSVSERREMDSIGAAPLKVEQPTAIRTEVKVETQQERNDYMKRLLDDLKPRE